MAAGFAGELNKIYVLRRVHRQGVGRLLLCNVARRFLREGVTSMLLFGEATNPSNAFYEAFGAERLYSDTGEFTAGTAGVTCRLWFRPAVAPERPNRNGRP
jgi:GNAT superfamily N-acetyltransferase